MLAAAAVLGNVGDDTMIEAHFGRGFGVTSTIGIEVSALKTEAQALHGLEAVRGWGVRWKASF